MPEQPPVAPEGGKPEPNLDDIDRKLSATPPLNSEEVEPPAEADKPEAGQFKESQYREEAARDPAHKFIKETPEQKESFLTKIFGQRGGGKTGTRAEAVPQTEAAEEKEAPKDELTKAREEYAETHRLLKEKVKLSGKQGKKTKAAIEEAAKEAPLDLSLLKLEKPEDQTRADEAREKFVAILQGRGLDKAQAMLVYEAEVKRLEYEDKKKNLLKQDIEEKEREIKANIENKSGLNEDNWTDKERTAFRVEIAFAKAKLFKKYIVQERELLQKAEAETWPPQEKKLWRKGVEWYLRQNRYARIAGTTLLMTGAFWALSGTTLLGAASYGSYRFGRALLSTTAGQAAAKGAGALSRIILEKRSNVKIIKERASDIDITNLSVDNLSEAEKEWAKEMEAKAKDKRIELYVKAAAAILVGGGTAYGLGLLGETWGGVPDKEAMTEIRPKPATSEGTAGPTATPTEAAKPAPSVPEAAPLRTEPPLESRPLHVQMVEAPPAVRAVLPEELDRAATAAEADAAATPSPEHLAELATIKKGEGIWHAVYRQLNQELRSDPSKFGLSQEDLDNSAKVKKVLNRETGKLLVEQNYIRPDGSEIRISEPGTKVILDPETHKITITGKVYEWQKPVPPLESRPLHVQMVEAPPAVRAVLPEELDRAATAAETIKPNAEYVRYVRSILGTAVEEQLNANLGEKLAKLGQLGENDVKILAQYLVESDPERFLKEGLFPGRIDISPLLENKILVNEILEFPQETLGLSKLGFIPEEYLKDEYILCIRNMTVDDYLARFPKEDLLSGKIVGEIKSFGWEGAHFNVRITEKYSELAKAMLSRMTDGGAEEVGKMSVKDFVKKIVAGR